MGVVEAFVGDQAELTERLRAPFSVACGAQFQAAAIPALGFVQVAQGGQVFVGVSEVEGDNRFFWFIANLLAQRNCFLVSISTLGLALFTLYMSELFY